VRQRLGLQSGQVWQSARSELGLGGGRLSMIFDGFREEKINKLKSKNETQGDMNTYRFQSIPITFDKMMNLGGYDI